MWRDYLRKAFIGLVLGLPAMAQLLPAEQSSLFWRAQDLVTVKDGVCTIQNRSTRKTKSFKVPSDLREVQVTEDGFWANRKTGREGSRDIEVHFSSDGVHWHLQTAWPVRGEAPSCRIFALKDRFLAVSTSAPFVMGEASSHFAVLRPQKGSLLQIESLLPMGIGKYTPGWVFVPTVIQAADGWAVANFRTGHIWVVKDAGGGSVKIRTSKLFASVKDEAIQDMGSIDPPILGCQPTLDGDLLLASRTEDAVLKTREFVRHQNKVTADPRSEGPFDGLDFSKKGPNPELEAKLNEATKQMTKRIQAAEAPALQAYPELLWWNFDPASCTYRRIPAPDGAPVQLLTPEIFQSFRFRFDVRGTLVVAE